VLEQVVETVPLHFAALQVVPERRQVANGCRGERDRRVERYQAADRQRAVEHLAGTGPEEEADAEKGDRLDRQTSGRVAQSRCRRRDRMLALANGKPSATVAIEWGG